MKTTTTTLSGLVSGLSATSRKKQIPSGNGNGITINTQLNKYIATVGMSLMLAGAAQAVVLYQDTFDNDTLATNTGIGGGAANNTILNHFWQDNGNAQLTHVGNVHNHRALLYSTNSFQNDGGLKLTVNYSISNISNSGENEFGFGLFSSDSNPSTYIGGNPFGRDASAYSLGVLLTANTASARGLNFSNGTTKSNLDSFVFANGTGTVVIEIAAGGAWNYSVNGTEQGSGTIAGFDLASSYHFAAYGRDDISNRSINSVTLEDINFVPEPTSTALLGLGGLALMLRRRR